MKIMNASFFTLIESFVSSGALPISNEQIEMMGTYADMLIKWNEKVNLTAIKDDEGIAIKHFIDSLTCLKIESFLTSKRAIDIGTGAGFPGLVLKIVRSDIEMVLVDSVGKKLDFVKAVVDELKLNEVSVVKGRAEDLARMKEYRATFDCALTRGVSAMPIILEYCLPFLRVGGSCLAMKGPKVIEEMGFAQTAARILGGSVSEMRIFDLPNDSGMRNIVEVRKDKETALIYPRDAGTLKRKPLM